MVETNKQNSPDLEWTREWWEEAKKSTAKFNSKSWEKKK